MINVAELGFQFPSILLPKSTIDLQKWAVIACDQFTSQPEYWDNVSTFVKDAPSTFHMILPELYLGTDQEKERIISTKSAMKNYMEEGFFDNVQGSLLVKRTIGGRTRHGLMLALDLNAYNFNKGSTTLIRATEGTIIERLPPRIRIREGASLELPHILVLIDDPRRTVIEPLVARSASLAQAYDFELMLSGGHLSGYKIEDPTTLEQIASALGKLASKDDFSQKYDVAPETPVLLFAIGDGNHSLATAKSIWDKIKGEVPAGHPARYAMIEIENIHDEGLEFEPIHRVLFAMKEGFDSFLSTFFDNRLEITQCKSEEEMAAIVQRSDAKVHRIGIFSHDGMKIISIAEPDFNLPVGTLQACLDAWLELKGAEKIDYVHGRQVVRDIGSLPGNMGFYLPGMAKNDLFKTVIKDGALPRKTFSMGEANEKRYYMECRKIS